MKASNSIHKYWFKKIIFGHHSMGKLGYKEWGNFKRKEQVKLSGYNCEDWRTESMTMWHERWHKDGKGRSYYEEVAD